MASSSTTLDDLVKKLRDLGISDRTARFALSVRETSPFFAPCWLAHIGAHGSIMRNCWGRNGRIVDLLEEVVGAPGDLLFPSPSAAWNLRPREGVLRHGTGWGIAIKRVART